MQTDINSIPKQDYLVLCDTITFNQASYIEDTMNGLCLQQTKFPYVCYIIDDASTDGEQVVIKAYLDKHFAMDMAETYELELAHVTVAKHKTNANCTFAVYLLKRNLWKEPALKYSHRKPWTDRCKYIALCEGDDYWTDPLKLQKQVDFLEGHEDYSMCFHRASILCEENMQESNIHTIECEKVEDREYQSTELFTHWVVPTASILYRKEVSKQKTTHAEWLTAGDIDLVLKCANQGKVFGMSDTMSAYRVHGNGLTQGAQYKSKLAMRHPLHYKCLYINYPKLDKESITWVIAASYYTRMRTRKDLWGKIGDLICMFYWNPKCARTKIGDIINRRIKK